jgi:hypothetical protein
MTTTWPLIYSILSVLAGNRLKKLTGTEGNLCLNLGCLMTYNPPNAARTWSGVTYMTIAETKQTRTKTAVARGSLQLSNA